jgi:hypothetical protein
MKIKQLFIIVSCFACLLACVGDFTAMYIFGRSIPGYSVLFSTMSSLGASNSPVSFQMSLWWVIMGLLVVTFGIGFRMSFLKPDIWVKTASWLLIIYGIGEGMGSGFFKADHIGNKLSTSCIIHDTLGGIGIAAIFILILIHARVFNKSLYPRFNVFSWIIFLIGIINLILFSFRFSNSENNVLGHYKGLWQNILVLDFYCYFIVLAFMIFKKQFATNKILQPL